MVVEEKLGEKVSQAGCISTSPETRSAGHPLLASFLHTLLSHRYASYFSIKIFVIISTL